MAIPTIIRNALRSLLTVLGMLSGVAAVIATVTDIQSSRRQNAVGFELSGTDIAVVLCGPDSLPDAVGEIVCESRSGKARPVRTMVHIKALSREVEGTPEDRDAPTFGTEREGFVILPIKSFLRRIAGHP